MNKELIEKIRRSFELNIYETKVWLALLTKGSASIAEIHELSKVPRSRIYDVLKSLENKGFCIERLGKPIKYIAVKPTIVIEKLKKEYEDATKEKISTLEKVRQSPEYTELEKLYETTFELNENIGSVIRGKNSVITHLANIIKNAQDKIVLVSTPNSLDKKLSVLLPTIAGKASKGVSVVIGVSNSGDMSKELENKIKKLKNVRVKNVEGEARFCVVDNYVLLITSPEDKEDSALWLQSKFFASTLEHLMKNAA